MLYIVPTPIGNLKDITLRAIETLQNVFRIAAEDTRRAQILLRHFSIKTPVMSFHSYSSDRKTEHILEMLREGKDIALISEAGMPGISDPGYTLISRAITEDIPLTVLPGATAAITALVASGFPMHNFVFLGFLPLKKHRKTLIESLRNEEKTIVFYEAPHRIIRTLQELHAALGERNAVCARELTKLHEEVLRGTLGELMQHFSKTKPRGEFTVILGPLV